MVKVAELSDVELEAVAGGKRKPRGEHGGGGDTGGLRKPR
jgi:hypothetical protein